MTELRWHRWQFAVVAVLLMIVQSAWAQRDATLARAQELIDSRQAQMAYELLIPALDQRAGEPAFDYLFALAALDSGHLSQGVFALERVLAVDPEHPQARAELARAFLLLGELDAARAEFETVKRSNPPAAVEATIDQYLEEIERRQGGPQGTQLRGYVAFTGGYDSNVNSAQDASRLNVPRFALLSAVGDGTVDITGSGISQADTFGQVAAGGSVFHRLGPQLALIANGALSQRWNQSERAFDTGDVRADLGITWQRAQDVVSVAAQANRFLLDRDQFRNAYGVFGQWRRSLNPSTTATGYAQVTALRYPSQRIRNANRYSTGGAVTKALGGRFKATATFGLYGGVERERASAVAHLGQRFIGATAAANFDLNAKISAFINTSAERRRYGGTDPFFLVQRGDTTYRVGGGIVYKFARLWNLTPQAYYSRNNSNVALNEYDRAILSLTLRRNFQ